MKFGIIGTGSIGRLHAEAIRALDGGTMALDGGGALMNQAIHSIDALIEAIYQSAADDGAKIHF